MERVRIGLLSDTHGYLDSSISACFADCDEIWHAGDIGSLDVLEGLRRLKPVRAVFGNIDGDAVRAEAPLDLEWECGGLRVYMTHINDARARREIGRRHADVFVCGHSHVLKAGRDPKLGVLHLNPGACGNQGFHETRTVLRFRLEAGRVDSVEAIALGPRGRRRATP